LLDGLGLSLEDGLDCAVLAVPYPAGDAGGFGAAANGVAEEDALDAAVDDDADAAQYSSSSS
jgi:hypothetical protein